MIEGDGERKTREARKSHLYMSHTCVYSHTCKRVILPYLGTVPPALVCSVSEDSIAAQSYLFLSFLRYSRGFDISIQTRVILE